MGSQFSYRGIEISLLFDIKIDPEKVKIMKSFLLICCVAFASAAVVDEFRAFKSRFNKSYSNAVENEHRMEVFADNLEKISKHNKEAAEGKHTFTLGVNQFADLTLEEWRKTLTLNVVKSGKPKETMKSIQIDIPDEIDWRDQGYVTPVKDQGACGSCWSFGVTGVMEGATKRATGELVSLSEQNLVDCDTNDYGCNGGLHPVHGAYPWIIGNGGINTEADYPYHARDMPCRFDDNKDTYTIKEYHETTEGDENEFTEKIATIGPINVGVDAGQYSFQFYKKGVYYEPQCSSTSLNHAMLTVGYGTESGKPFYWVKNSWSTSWGDNGYIKMSKNRNNNCGIATDATWVVV